MLLPPCRPRLQSTRPGLSSYAANSSNVAVGHRSAAPRLPADPFHDAARADNDTPPETPSRLRLPRRAPADSAEEYPETPRSPADSDEERPSSHHQASTQGTPAALPPVQRVGTGITRALSSRAEDPSHVIFTALDFGDAPPANPFAGPPRAEPRKNPATARPPQVRGGPRRDCSWRGGPGQAPGPRHARSRPRQPPASRPTRASSAAWGKPRVASPRPAAPPSRSSRRTPTTPAGCPRPRTRTRRGTSSSLAGTRTAGVRRIPSSSSRGGFRTRCCCSGEAAGAERGCGGHAWGFPQAWCLTSGVWEALAGRISGRAWRWWCWESWCLRG